MAARLLIRREYDAGELARRHPPRWRHPHKAAIADLLARTLPAPAGSVETTRWQPDRRKPRLPPELPTVEIRAGFFTYETDANAWHVNFADANLFGAYGSPLLAQDELQVLEHPILACVREAWLAEGLPASTFDGQPTPVLVRNAERRLALDLLPAEGRPDGLYGYRFARAPVEAVLSASHPVDPPTVSHILAMEAPHSGSGRYSRETLAFVIGTAATGFAAARAETPGPACTIHTGYWGCGVYGGSRQAMTQLQLVAARAAGIPRIIFHGGSAPEIAAGAIAQLEESGAWKAEQPTEEEVVEAIFGFAYSWGRGDGN